MQMIKVSDYRRIKIPYKLPEFDDFSCKLQGMSGKYVNIHMAGEKRLSGLVLWVKEGFLAVKTKKNIYYIVADKIISISLLEV